MDVLHNQTFPSVHLHKICTQALPRKQQPVKVREGKATDNLSSAYFIKFKIHINSISSNNLFGWA